MSRSFRIPRLKSGGLITTYHCVARCGHCLYNCGPSRSKAYMDRETAVDCLTRIKALGCRTLHIGGGEPVFQVDRLCEILEAAQEAGVLVEYVETNAAWFTGDGSRVILKQLKKSGLTALLVSISPFHNEFIPYERVINLSRACRELGIRVIPWSHVFNPLLSKCDPTTTHDWQSLEKEMKGNLSEFVMSNYRLQPGGRARSFFRACGKTDTIETILAQDKYGCERTLTDTSHFHVDPDRLYIPGLCAGLAIPLDDVGKTLDFQFYPLIHILMSKGIRGLLGFAQADYGYEPSRETFAGKCDLCNDIRFFLVQKGWSGSDELAPKSYNENMDSFTDP